MGVPLLVGNVGNNLRDMVSIGLPLTFADRIIQATGIDDVRIQDNDYGREIIVFMSVKDKNGNHYDRHQIYDHDMMVRNKNPDSMIEDLIFQGRKLKAAADNLPEPVREKHIDNNIFNYIGV